MPVVYLTAFLGAIVLSFIFTRRVRNTALARGWVYQPASARHIHKESIPRLGGIAIFLTFVLITGVLLAASLLLRVDAGLAPQTVLYLLLPATLIFLVGLYDDCFSISPYTKFTAQAVAAVILYMGGFRVLRVPLLFGSTDLGWVSLPLTIFWVLWITNAFNLIDGIDGLAAGSALFSTLTVFVVSLVNGNCLISVMTVGLAGAILGFLRFNFNPATIFLGDSGSLVIGFLLSAFALAGAPKSSTLIAVAIPVVSFGLPLLETIISVIRRFLSGQPIFGADREHIHHKLLDRGMTQRQAVIILYGVSAGCGLLSLFLLYPSGPTVGIVLLIIGVGIWVGVQHLDYHEFFEISRVAQRTIKQKKIIVNNLAVRRAARDLSTAQNFEEITRALQSAFARNEFDGYELQLTPEALQRARSIATSTLPITWTKEPAANRPLATSPTRWTLNLDLISSTQEEIGVFTLYREYNSRPLLLDINLLISKFPVAIADAIDRASSRVWIPSENAKPLTQRPVVIVPLVGASERAVELNLSK